ncbi:uncharacterized protein LOC114522620 [Dendronephthya gigantea]|uniref:uncharacterized protein LOC114522620 n=1 Tax=Dendronephthya gigantea TaxID=151771 RepID=UPI001069B87D|nr:uncharacterized protein LOC114522620 [Dendronephthya gigantea]
MLLKILLCFCLFQMVQSGGWIKIAFNKCVGARYNHYREFTYRGSSMFITAMKLVHRNGWIGCSPGSYTRWGCSIAGNYETNMIVTDTRNIVMYPSPTLVTLRTGGWYDLAGYYRNSPKLVFSDPGLRYLYRGQKIRIWYGEDLFNYRESNNHGFTCMDVYVYKSDC